MVRVYNDGDGYKRGFHSNLRHREIAYHQIYLPNRKEYPQRFSKYQVHHKDGNKLNNAVSNLQLVLREEHENIHGYKFGGQKRDDGLIDIAGIILPAWAWIIFLIIIIFFIIYLFTIIY